MRALMIICVALVLAACGSTKTAKPRALSEADAARIARETIAYQGHADTVACDLMVRVAAPGRDSLIFTINLWSPKDGRTRLKISKLGFDFCDAVVRPDGSFDAYLSRSNESVRGTLRDLLPADSAGNLALMINEFKDGPLPVGVALTPGDNSVQFTDPMTGLRAVAEPASDGPGLGSKVIVAGTEAFKIAYAQYQDMDGLRRPSRVTVTSSKDPTEVAIRVRSIDVLPDISAGRMTVSIPDKAREISLPDFLRRIDE